MMRRSDASWSLPFANDGGPLIVLPRELLGSWRGIDGEPVREDFRFGPDYTRACDAAHPAALLEIGAGYGLVIGAQDHVCEAQWLRVPGEPWAALVGWDYADDGSDARVVELLRSDGLRWHRFRRRMKLAHGDLLLFHAGTPGDEVRERATSSDGPVCIGDALPLRLGSGEYALEWVELGGDLDRDTLGCVVCRWQAPSAGPT